MGTKNLVYGCLLGGIVVLVLQFQSQPLPQDQIVPVTPVAARLEMQPEPEDASRMEHAEHLPLRQSQAGEQHRSIPVGDLRQLLKHSIGDAKFRAPTVSELGTFERLFARTLRSNVIDSMLFSSWKSAGWQLHQCNDDVLVISELPSRRTGRGIYAVRLGFTSDLVLQAPHRFYDQGSGIIARTLFEEHSVSAAAWNTVHRRQVDLAHCEENFINAFSAAIVNCNRQAKILQLHGFDARKNDLDSRASSVKLIVSDGTKFPRRHIVRATANLKTELGAGHVLLFPSEIDVLGGTLNSQARHLRSLGSHGFLHVEMEKAFRQSLIDSPRLRSDFINSFRSMQSIR
ncbi:hypothetical protein [Planctomycetes bacterium K23_9]|uniref:Uncharacterized protein n=1 Tax=Stieleria marina TaxID=1930275 RepID=A0A517NYE9_9BACT|nr:hypothetical protein K239x_41510 [Planctomycetes bacterium K23_9]